MKKMKKNLLFILSIFMFSSLMAQDCSDLFFSEYVEGSYNNKALEVYNPTDQAIDLSNYQMSRYSNGGTSPNYVSLSPGGILNAHSVLVVVLDKRDPEGTGQDTIVFDELRALADIFLCPVYTENKMMYFNGNDAVTLEKLDGTILDIIGKVGEDPGQGWTDDASSGFVDTGEWWRLWTKDQTLVRKPGVLHGVFTNPSEFNPTLEWDSLPRNTFDSLRMHTCDCGNAAWTDPNSISEIIPSNDAIFFPNPVTNNEFTVKGTEIIKSVEVYNSLGQVVLNKVNNVARGDMHIILDNVQAGLFFVKVTFRDNSSINKKLLVR